jgi:3-oxoacyl-[acyl-carrier protein] reductase
MGKLTGKIAIVTGGASGIGKAITMILSKEGASVVVADINLQMAEETAAEIKTSGREAVAVKTDVSDWNDIESMAKKAIDRFGRIDILVNNAGIGRATGSLISPDHALIENLTEAEWEKVMSVNCKSVFLCCKAVAKKMKEQKSGRIINISSVDGKTGSAGGIHYAASKAGVISLTKSLARQLASFNINVNSVAPGTIVGTMFETAWTEKEKSEDARKTALGRLGRPEEIADAVLFLASDSASYITGEILDVNGGSYMD